MLSFAIDNNAADKAAVIAQVVGASNETLPAIAPAAAGLAQLQWVFVAASNLFERVTESQDVSLSGSGILLYPNLDPNGLLALHFMVIESQEGARDLGKLLTEVFADKAVKGAVDVFAKVLTGAIAGVPGLAAAAVMRAVISVVPKVVPPLGDPIRVNYEYNELGLIRCKISWKQYDHGQLGDSAAGPHAGVL